MGVVPKQTSNTYCSIQCSMPSVVLAKNGVSPIKLYKVSNHFLHHHKLPNLACRKHAPWNSLKVNNTCEGVSTKPVMPHLSR